MNRFFACIVGLSFSLPLLWLVGISTIDLARVCVVLIGLGLVQNWKCGERLFLEARLRQGFLKVLQFFAVLAVLAQSLSFARSIFTGNWGLDSVIFSQVVQRFGHHGDFLSSINRVGFQNFLSDHFSPILAVPGVLVKAGLTAPEALVLVHVTAIVLALICLHCISRESKGFGWLCVFIFLIFPSVRHQLGWGTQVEFFALPFVGAAYLSFGRNQLILGVLAWVGASLCKETLSCYAVAFFGSIFLIELHRSLVVRESWRMKRIWISLIAMCLFGGWFFVYVHFHKFLFDLPYDHLNRLRFSDLLDPKVLAEKFIFFVSIVSIPGILLVLRGRGGWFLTIVPVSPFFAMVLVSGFSNMWNLLTHYSVLPAYLLLCGFLTTQQLNERLPVRPPSMLLFSFMIALCFCFGNRRPMTSLLRQSVAKIPIPEQLTGDQKVVRADYGLIAVAMQRDLQHEWLRPTTPLEVYPIQFSWFLAKSAPSQSVEPCAGSEHEEGEQAQPRKPYWLLYCHDRLQ